MTRMLLAKVDSLRSLYQLPLPAGATDADALCALNEFCPKVTLRATPKGITITGAGGRKRLIYPFMNDTFFQVAIDLR